MSLAGWAQTGLAACREVFAQMAVKEPEPESDDNEENKSSSQASPQEFNFGFFSQSWLMNWECL